MKQKEEEYSDVLRLVLGSSLQSYESDEKLYSEARAQIIHRDQNYSKLLKSYVSISKARNFLKEVHKWLLFWGIVFACVKGFGLLNQIISPILESKDVAVIVDAMPVLIAALVSFVSAVIAVPLAVVNFLFNTKEDDNITDIIKHTQEHDAAGRTWVNPQENTDKPKS